MRVSFSFLANEVDGDDFFNFEFSEICQLLQRFKLRKRFIAVWSEVTGQVLNSKYFFKSKNHHCIITVLMYIVCQVYVTNNIHCIHIRCIHITFVEHLQTCQP
jgi:hypothetical protein